MLNGDKIQAAKLLELVKTTALSQAKEYGIEDSMQSESKTSIRYAQRAGKQEIKMGILIVTGIREGARNCAAAVGKQLGMSRSGRGHSGRARWCCGRGFTRRDGRQDAGWSAIRPLLMLSQNARASPSPCRPTLLSRGRRSSAKSAHCIAASASNPWRVRPPHHLAMETEVKTAIAGLLLHSGSRNMPPDATYPPRSPTNCASSRSLANTLRQQLNFTSQSV